jgi:RecQ family ATP-dependent DNA helicase
MIKLNYIIKNIIINDDMMIIQTTKDITLDKFYSINSVLMKYYNNYELFYDNDQREYIKNNHNDENGIVYCLSRKKVEKIASELKKAGFCAYAYHAGMDSEKRKKIQTKFNVEENIIIVATIAFGMGIDKPNVRFVAHLDLPKSIEGYYQETGRAGRDGLESKCILYYSYRDKTIIEFLIEKGEGNYLQKERQRHNLRQVISFCENPVDCRRQQVLSYFGERFDPAQCKETCDNCRRKVKGISLNILKEALEIVKLVKEIQGDQITMIHAIDVYRGMKTSKINSLNHSKVNGYGKGSKKKKHDVERIFRFLVLENILMEKVISNPGGYPTAYLAVLYRCFIINFLAWGAS